MLHNIYKASPHREQIRMNDDQIAYVVEKHKKGNRIKIKFGKNIIDKVKFYPGAKLIVFWDDFSKMMLIAKADEEGYTLMKPKNQKHFIMFREPAKIKLPQVKHIFKTIPTDGQNRITLDFSLIPDALNHK